MKLALRRFFAVGLLVTAVDLGLLFGLVSGAGWPPVLADVLSVGFASALSYLLHRAITLKADPAQRWYHDPRRVLFTMVIAGAADVATLGGLLVLMDSSAVGTLLLAKLVALLVAFLIRMTSYRRVMATNIRRDQLRPIQREAATGDVRLSVVVPAFCEAEGIGGAVIRIREALGRLETEGGYEVVVVDDGSSDATAELAESAGADKVIRFPANRGKGAAVREGARVARGRTIVFTDADLAYPPDQIFELLAGVEDGYDVVVGSRRHPQARTVVRTSRLRQLGGAAVNVLTTFILLGNYRDTQCGLKAFRSDAARLVFSQCRIDGFAFDIEVLHLVERHRLTLAEVPVNVVYGSRSTVRVTRDAYRLMRDVFRIRTLANRGAYELDIGDGAPADAR